MSAHALPREFAFYVATSFDESGGPADWSTNGTYAYVTELDTTGLVRTKVENTNNRLTLRDFHDGILTRRNASMKVGMYLHSSTTHAAEGAAAVAYHLATFAKSALGGLDLGYGIGIASDEAEGTAEVQIDSDPGYVFGDAVFLYDTSGTRGEFYLTQSIAAGPPVTLTLDRPKHFTADTGGTDRIYSVADLFIDDFVTTNRTNANHTTLWIRAQGSGSEDVQTAKGCKPQLGQLAIAAGQPMTMSFDVMVTTHSHETDTTEDFSAASLLGSAPVVTGLADQTIVKIAAVGSPLADVDAYGTITIDPGVKYTMIEGANGWEGNHGFVDSGDKTTVELLVDFDAAWATGFNAGTTYHMLIQVGVGTDAVGFYFPRLTFAESGYPTRDESGNITVNKLMFNALKGNASISGLSAADARKLNAPFHIFLVA